MIQRQIVKDSDNQIEIEDAAFTKYPITTLHSIVWTIISINVTIYRIALEQRYQTSHYIMMTSKLLRKCI
jgi:hypothetical protein